MPCHHRRRRSRRRRSRRRRRRRLPSSPSPHQVNSAQKSYNLPSQGKCGTNNCQQWYIRITHGATLSGPDNLSSRPEVFLSGELHGNERVGPTATVETARIMLMAADCVERGAKAGDPDLTCDDLSPEEEAMLTAMDDGGTHSEAELKAVRTARLLWLHRLAMTRSLIIMPTANALGYHKVRSNTTTSQATIHHSPFPFHHSPFTPRSLPPYTRSAEHTRGGPHRPKPRLSVHAEGR